MFPLPPTTAAQSPDATAMVRPAPVTDLGLARRVRSLGASAAGPAGTTVGWCCTECGLAAVGFGQPEAAYLARVHDELRHGGRSTARVEHTGDEASDPPLRQA